MWRLGSSLLGYDAATGASVPFPAAPPCTDPDWRALTEEPRRYGFHATLKPPFALADGTDEAALMTAARTFARDRPAITVGELEVATIGAFTGLVPATSSPAVEVLAADSVRVFDPFRRPLSAADRARRLASPLTARQRDHLDRWGHPYVFEDFRFHMTLTGPLPEPRRQPIRAALALRFAPLRAGVPVDAVTLFRQERRDLPFRVLERCPFGG